MLSRQSYMYVLWYMFLQASYLNKVFSHRQKLEAGNHIFAMLICLYVYVSVSDHKIL